MWKEKNVSELYDFINTNKHHVPASLAQKADKSFRKEDSNKIERTNNNDIDITMEEDELDNYIETIHKYVEQKDADETESCFKDTIVAYLDLIDENPRKKTNQAKQVKPKKNIFSKHCHNEE